MIDIFEIRCSVNAVVMLALGVRSRRTRVLVQRYLMHFVCKHSAGYLLQSKDGPADAHVLKLTHYLLIVMPNIIVARCIGGLGLCCCVCPYVSHVRIFGVVVEW